MSVQITNFGSIALKNKPKEWISCSFLWVLTWWILKHYVSWKRRRFHDESNNTPTIRNLLNLNPTNVYDFRASAAYEFDTRTGLLLMTEKGRASWGHFFKRSLWPHKWNYFKNIGPRWNIWIIYFWVSFLSPFTPVFLTTALRFHLVHSPGRNYNVSPDPQF